MSYTSHMQVKKIEGEIFLADFSNRIYGGPFNTNKEAMDLLDKFAREDKRYWESIMKMRGKPYVI